MSQATRDFDAHTFKVIAPNKPHITAAIFTFGREDLIPAIFMEKAENFGTETGILKYYLEWHIEADGDHHSHLAYEMTAAFCSEDPGIWLEATALAQAALLARLAL